MITRGKYGEWACVVGAAEGLGAAFANSLAKRGFSLVLVDIKKDLLTRTSVQLRESFQIETREVFVDLSRDSASEIIMNPISELDCRLLVYNAAYGPVLPFLSNSEEDLDIYLSVNNRTLLMLIYKFIKRSPSSPMGILLISSLAGLRGTRLVIPYAATKAFIWNLAEGLHYEFKNKQLDISVVCAGTVDTPNFRATKPKMTFFMPKPMKPVLVSEEALNKFGRQLFIVPGLSNKIAVFLFNRILPRKIASKFHNDTMAQLYKEKSI